MKYRKKPIVIEAEQWFTVLGSSVKGVEFAKPPFSTGPARWGINTLEGWFDIKDSDWVITGVNGEKYPCKPDVFEKSYEAV